MVYIVSFDGRKNADVDAQPSTTDIFPGIPIAIPGTNAFKLLCVVLHGGGVRTQHLQVLHNFHTLSRNKQKLETKQPRGSVFIRVTPTRRPRDHTYTPLQRLTWRRRALC